MLTTLVDRRGDTLFVAAIDTTESTSGLTFGSVVDAHGSHDRPSTRWTVPLDPADSDNDLAATTIPPLTVYDAAFGDGAIAYATGEGLSIATPKSGKRIDLITSRAIRFVAA